MKKLLVLLCLSVALLGCGEKKVTEEMLLGDWRCTGTQQDARWKNGLFQDYDAPVDHGAMLVKFSKENDTLFWVLPDGGGKIEQDFKKLNESFDNSLDDMRTAGSNKLEYISDNEFNLIIEVTRTYDRNKREKEIENKKNKKVMHCTRIK